FGGGSSQTAFGARAGATLLSRLTTAFAVVFMLTALALAIIGQRGPGSVVSGAPPPPSSAPKAPTPASPSPASGAPAGAPAPAGARRPCALAGPDYEGGA